jgi:hypothetical protein
MLLYLICQRSDGTAFPTVKIELQRLPAVAETLRPPDAPRVCFVTRAVPSSIEATGDVRVGGWVYADAIDGRA